MIPTLQVGQFGRNIWPHNDPYWWAVKLLVSCEGANGSSTFTDLADSPATVTREGAATVSTTYAANGALACNGTSHDLVTTRNAAVGTGAFTLEAFIRCGANHTGRIFSAQSTGTPNALIALRVDTGGSLTGMLRNSGGTGLLVLTSAAGAVTTDSSTEYHVAFTRDASGNVNIWKNGVSVANSTSSTNPDASRPYYLGSYGNNQEWYGGDIRWARVTEGVCRYTATFNPPTIPLPRRS